MLNRMYISINNNFCMNVKLGFSNNNTLLLFEKPGLGFIQKVSPLKVGILTIE